MNLSILHTVTVSSQVPPVQNVALNTAETIYCDFHGYPITSLTWRFNNQPISTPVFTAQHQQVIGENGEGITRAYLRFKPHSVLLTGVYTCTAQQSQNQAQCRVTTNVQGIIHIIAASWPSISHTIPI